MTAPSNRSLSNKGEVHLCIARGPLGVRVQIRSASCVSMYSANILGSLFLRLFHCVLLNVWLTLAALRIFSLVASHPQEATVLSLTSFASTTFRGSPPATSGRTI